MIRHLVRVGFLALMLANGAIFAVQAQQPIAPEGQPTSASGWSFNIAPYLWTATIAAGVNLNLPQQLGGTVSADSSIGFGNLASHLHFAAMVTGDARYDRFQLLTDYIFLSVGGADTSFRSLNFTNHPRIPIPVGVQTHVGMNLTASIWTMAGGYTLVQGDWGEFDAIAGFRFLAINPTINYDLALSIAGPRGNGATFGGNGSVSGSADIWNGIGGFRGHVKLGSSGFFIPYYFDIGAGGSNLTWQISSGIGYHASWADLSLSYRYLTFQQGSGVLDHLTVRGPMLMASFPF
jgi:hypothetical protein